jgi:hypothetical protein
MNPGGLAPGLDSLTPGCVACILEGFSCQVCLGCAQWTLPPGCPPSQVFSAESVVSWCLSCLSGICLCSHHTEGPSCERCLPGFYGNPFKGQADDCQPCPCPGQSACTTIPESREVVCTHCPPGQRGEWLVPSTLTHGKTSPDALTLPSFQGWGPVFGGWQVGVSHWGH